jgi:uncharacterized protein (TIGR03437 family)
MLENKKIIVAATLIVAGAAFAQTGSFSGFSAGNLVVSRTVYTGTATTLKMGQALPPVCPATAACGTATATDNGAYPSTSSTNNVFNNDKVDGSFGVTSPIFLDQITPTGTVVNTLAIPGSMASTSFSSKSEMALNVSADGSAITFMAYIAPPNTVDVSNGNTPGAYDPTNPAGGSYYRAVVQVGANGAIQVTPTNSYSGNNGRAAILANGLYYMAGNANNGGGTPANIVTTAGIQMAVAGQPASMPAVDVGTFSITQVNDPSTGMPYASDKLGKDNNFRGLTLFNNTLYTTKGSGSNGVNTVYQVGATGSLPTLANAEEAPITILPGFPTVLASNANAAYPFGIFFANATTLYVADEGDGTVANAATSKTSGLQKWSLVNGTWTMDYVLQSGLNLGMPYSVTNYPTSLNPATDGLRNISGKVNTDGTVTIYGITSTVSSNGDAGADPNLLVAITDTLSNLTAAGASKETFTVIKSAAAGEVLRGVSLTPTAGSTPAVNAPSIISAASPMVIGVAPGSVATAGGLGLATGAAATGAVPYPTMLGGTTVSIIDAGGRTTAAPLLYASSTQVNFLVPANVATGIARVAVTAGGTTVTSSYVPIATVAPALYTLNGTGLAAATAVRVAANGTQTNVPVYTVNSDNSLSAAPISLGVATDQVYLTLYGTGLQAAGTSKTTVTINGVTAKVTFAGAQGATSPGLDQVNVLIPASLAGKGNVNVQLAANGINANPVQITIQ